MSKIQLKKELQTMEAPQLREMILEAYSARKEIKEYFEFFLNPDIEHLLDKYQTIILKELRRTKRGSYSKARISFIRKQIKEFSSFQPGYEALLDIRFFTLANAINLEAYLYYPDTLYKGIALLINDILDIANASQVFAETQQRLEKLLSKSTLGTRRYRTYLASVLRDALSTTALL
ncbi:MAG: DUF6155 family protein [Muribaculaceae bacterium]|nr:DUF6155 family protein [Muribaculaceae bacterium]